MTLSKLDLAPSADNYAARFGAATRRAETDGGRGRHRLDHLGVPCSISATWEATKVEYDYLAAFYRDNVAGGVGPFLVDLIIDGPIAEQQARFQPGSLKLSAQSGDDHFVATASLEVTPPARDAAADAALVTSYAAAVDGLPLMAIVPGSQNYSVDRGDEILQSANPMGPTTIRAGFPGAPAAVRLSWGVSAARLRYLAAFYFTAIREAALPFVVPLVLDNGVTANHVALMVPGSFQLSGLTGNTHLVSADAVTQPLPRDEAADNNILAFFPDPPP